MEKKGRSVQSLGSIAYPLLRRNGQKAKSKLRGGLCCNFHFPFLFWGLRWCWMEVKCVKANRYELDFCTSKSPLSGPFQLSERTKKSPPGIPKMQILYAIPPHLLACTGRSFLLSIFSLSCILLTMLQRWTIIFNIKA